jgi:hypothetical protein
MKFWLKGNVTIPPKPRTVGGLIGWARGVNRALADLRDMKIVGTVAPRQGGRMDLPFSLSVSKVADAYNWKVSSKYSTITDGTNGDSLAITNFDTDTVYTATKWIVVEGAVTDLAVSSLQVKAVDDPAEVVMSGSPLDQSTIRLLIGKVSIVDDAPVFDRFLTEAARLTYGFLNGKLVRVFELAPVHQSYAPPP